MKRATVTLTGDLAQALETYRQNQEVPPGLSAVMQVALREYLVERGYLKPVSGADGPHGEHSPQQSLAEALGAPRAGCEPGVSDEEAEELPEGASLSEAVLSEREGRGL